MLLRGVNYCFTKFGRQALFIIAVEEEVYIYIELSISSLVIPYPYHMSSNIYFCIYVCYWNFCYATSLYGFFITNGRILLLEI
jgi:hypothetical protein